jgi:hypothetical protein
MIEAVHLPLHIRSFLRGTLSPVAALPVTIMFFLIWLLASLWSPFQDEIFFRITSELYPELNGWIVLSYFKAATAAMLPVAYLVYIVYAGKAVHYLRMEKKRKAKTHGKNVGSVNLEAPIELDQGTLRV